MNLIPSLRVKTMASWKVGGKFANTIAMRPCAMLAIVVVILRELPQQWDRHTYWVSLLGVSTSSISGRTMLRSKSRRGRTVANEF
jgi:hypothetical protein